MAIKADILAKGIDGDSYSRDLIYRVTGATTDIAALDYMEANVPTTYDALPLRLPMKISILTESPLIFKVVVTYSKDKSNNTPPASGTANVEYDFDFGLENTNVKKSLATINKYAPAGSTAPDFKGAINVSSDGTVEGADIQSPVSTFGYTLTADVSFFSDAYLKKVEEAVGKVNSTAFKTRAAGEVLFLGAQGRVSTAGDSSINFKFARSKNRTGLTIGGITGIDKKGFEYLWVYYGKVEDAVAKAIVKQPKGVYVEQMYETVDLATELGFG